MEENYFIKGRYKLRKSNYMKIMRAHTKGEKRRDEKSKNKNRRVHKLRGSFQSLELLVLLLY